MAKKFCIVGSGAWGTALAQVLLDNKQNVIIYGNVASQIDDININKKNSQYFSDVILHKDIKATLDMASAIKDADYIITSVPTIAMRSVVNDVVKYLTKPAVFINTSKGFDPNTSKRMSEIILEVVPNDKLIAVASLIGPSHAEEVIVRDLTCVCAVSEDLNVATKIAKYFSNDYFRVYVNDDVIGSEIGVAMKNAIALASGILGGLKYGDNARAALCTRGLAEIVRFGTRYGGKVSTYLGLTGLGDLIVTCYSFHSRNFNAGMEIGKADSAKQFLENNTKTVEGIRTVEVIHRLAKQDNIDVPIIDALYRIIYENKKPSSEVKKLMLRPLKKE